MSQFRVTVATREICLQPTVQCWRKVYDQFAICATRVRKMKKSNDPRELIRESNHQFPFQRPAGPPTQFPRDPHPTCTRSESQPGSVANWVWNQNREATLLNPKVMRLKPESDPISSKTWSAPNPFDLSMLQLKTKSWNQAQLAIFLGPRSDLISKNGSWSRNWTPRSASNSTRSEYADDWSPISEAAFSSIQTSFLLAASATQAQLAIVLGPFLITARSEFCRKKFLIVKARNWGSDQRKTRDLSLEHCSDYSIWGGSGW